MKVFIYKNLTRNCWSIRCQEGRMRGRVIHHALSWTLYNVVFKVSQSGRARVLHEKRKNVHAGITGYLDSWVGLDGHTGSLVTNPIDTRGNAVSYNPYRGDHFYRVTDGTAIATASMVQADANNVYAYD